MPRSSPARRGRAARRHRPRSGPAETGAFVASFYLPWAFKWAFGPMIDVFGSERLGRRRGWILGTQVLMALTLLSTVMLKLPEQLWLFTVILLVHNTFGTMQDVAIDALACDTLQEHERGTANGMMFAGAAIGQLIGGSGVLFLMGHTDFQSTFFFVAGSILLVTAFIVLPMREAAGPARAVVAGSRMRAAGRKLHDFAINSFRSFLGTRGAFSGLLCALLPAGAMCLGLSLQSNLAVELGLDNDEVATLNAWSAVVSAVAMVAGGYLSDRLGRRRMLALYIACIGLPVLYLMSMLTQYGWIVPVSPNAPNRPEVPAALVTALWIASLVYSLFNGLMYGTRSAIMMDVTNPRVAATQFTAYMALMNLTISYSAAWQGIAAEAWGYPRTMLVDVIFGMIGIAAIPFMARRADEAYADSGAPARARTVAGILGLMCLAWLPYRIWHEVFGVAQPIAGTVFTRVFIASALFLLAGHAVLGDAARALTRIGAWLAPLLFLMYARYYIDAIAGGFSFLLPAEQFKNGVEIALRGVPLAAGAVLLLLALRPWRELIPQPAGASAS